VQSYWLLPVPYFFFPRFHRARPITASPIKRALLGIPHCLDVTSNVPFLIFGVWGIFFVLPGGAESRFVDPRERWPYFIFFLGVALTAFGSAYFHLRPNDSRLVGDRIPMTIGFTGLVAGVVSERISVQAGLRLLAPLVALGIGSVWYWRMTEANTVTYGFTVSCNTDRCSPLCCSSRFSRLDTRAAPTSSLRS